MEFTLPELVRAFGFSLLCGVALAVVYEPFRIFHKLGFDKSIHYFICDVLFMIIFAVITYMLCLVLLEGCVRLFVIIGEAAGFAAFYFTLRPLLNKIYDPIIKISKKIALKLLKIIRKILYNTVSRFAGALHCIKYKVLKYVKKRTKPKKIRIKTKKIKIMLRIIKTLKQIIMPILLWK